MTFCRQPLVSFWLFSNNSNFIGSLVWTLSPFPGGHHSLMCLYSGESGLTALKTGYRAVCAVYICSTAESSFLVTLLPDKTFSCGLGLAQKSCSAVSIYSMQVWYLHPSHKESFPFQGHPRQVKRLNTACSPHFTQLPQALCHLNRQKMSTFSSLDFFCPQCPEEEEGPILIYFFFLQTPKL